MKRSFQGKQLEIQICEGEFVIPALDERWFNFCARINGVNFELGGMEESPESAAQYNAERGLSGGGAWYPGEHEEGDFRPYHGGDCGGFDNHQGAVLCETQGLDCDELEDKANEFLAEIEVTAWRKFYDRLHENEE